MRAIREDGEGLEFTRTPFGHATVPVTWRVGETMIECEFVAGFFGTRFDELSGELTPEVALAFRREVKRKPLSWDKDDDL